MSELSFSQAAKLYGQIASATKQIGIRRLGSIARQQTYGYSNDLVKIAFDTRRVNQETERNPRGNLQYYHRSEPYIDGDMSVKIAYFMKIKTAVDMLKDRYGKEPEWFDSYARILSAALDRALRTEQKDADFYKAQFNYLDELLYVRYRLNTEDIQKMGEMDIERVILSRDEKLLHKQIYGMQQPAPMAISAIQPAMPVIAAPPPDPLIDKLMSGIKATSDAKDVSRSITITVRDKINDFVKQAKDDE